MSVYKILLIENNISEKSQGVKSSDSQHGSVGWNPGPNKNKAGVGNHSRYHFWLGYN